jgi:hypothetical protein
MKFGNSVKEVWVITDRNRDKEQEAKKRQWVMKLGCPDNCITKIQNTWVFVDEKFAMMFFLKWSIK